jgi:hypothetical protein
MLNLFDTRTFGPHPGDRLLSASARRGASAIDKLARWRNCWHGRRDEAWHMRISRPQMTSAEFNAALRKAGFGVERARIVDVSGQCPGFATVPTFRNGTVDRNVTLAKVIREWDAEIARRAAKT